MLRSGKVAGSVVTTTSLSDLSGRTVRSPPAEPPLLDATVAKRALQPTNLRAVQGHSTMRRLRPERSRHFLPAPVEPPGVRRSKAITKGMFLQESLTEICVLPVETVGDHCRKGSSIFRACSTNSRLSGAWSGTLGLLPLSKGAVGCRALRKRVVQTLVSIQAGDRDHAVIYLSNPARYCFPT